MSAQVDVTNLALSRIGIRTLLATVGDSRVDAIQAAALWPTLRDDVLAEAPWPFAEQQSILAATNDIRAGWQYAYLLPADCINPKSVWCGASVKPFPPGSLLQYPTVWTGGRTPLARQKIPFTLQATIADTSGGYAGAGKGQILLSDFSDTTLTSPNPTWQAFTTYVNFNIVLGPDGLWYACK